MLELRYDIARCTGRDCPVRHRCARYTSKWRPHGPQTVQAFTPGLEGCPDMIDNGVERPKTAFDKWMEGLL